MAAGDLVLEATFRVLSDRSEQSEGSGTQWGYRQETTLGVLSDTLVDGSVGNLPVVVQRYVPGGSNGPETLFDSTKNYKVTIEEA